MLLCHLSACPQCKWTACNMAFHFRQRELSLQKDSWNNQNMGWGRGANLHSSHSHTTKVAIHTLARHHIVSTLNCWLFFIDRGFWFWFELIFSLKSFFDVVLNCMQAAFQPISEPISWWFTCLLFAHCTHSNAQTINHILSMAVQAVRTAMRKPFTICEALQRTLYVQQCANHLPHLKRCSAHCMYSNVQTVQHIWSTAVHTVRTAMCEPVATFETLQRTQYTQQCANQSPHLKHCSAHCTHSNVQSSRHMWSTAVHTVCTNHSPHVKHCSAHCMHKPFTTCEALQCTLYAQTIHHMWSTAAYTDCTAMHKLFTTAVQCEIGP